MKVNVLFFASLREVAGCPGVALELPEGGDFEALCLRLQEQLGGTAVSALRAGNVRIARNHALEEPPFGLQDGDEVAFLPPVTGG